MPDQVKSINGKDPKEKSRLFVFLKVNLLILELYRQQSPIDIIPEHVVYDNTLKSAKLKIYYHIGDADTLEVGFVWMF